MKIQHARLETPERLHILFTDPPGRITTGDIILAPAIPILGVRKEGFEIVVMVEPVDLSRRYMVLVRGFGMTPLDIQPCLRGLSSDLPLGCIVEESWYVFRLFAPRAISVRLHLFEDVEDDIGTQFFLTSGENGIWQITMDRGIDEKYYAFSIEGSREPGEMFNSRILVGDPYGSAVVTKNTFRQNARCVLPDHIPAYDWEGDTYVTVPHEDLIIYEMHVKDMTAHPSSGVSPGLAGTYRGLVSLAAASGLAHIRALGVNAVELLPAQHYAWIEPPYMQHAGGNIYNDWNPYERNHWGYMTSYFFAPEPRYATCADLTPGHWNTAAPHHITEFRDMVKEMHRAGLAVIMDVVYNHTSQYDYQPLKYIDKLYYYRTAPDGSFIESSGCGNDLDSRMPMTRRLIVDSVLYWLEEFHIDGFRFDLAPIIDTETFMEIRERARAIHPGVILIAEPWGGGAYALDRFSEIGYGAWNDIFRNGVKGYDPMHGQGYIFGTWGASSPVDFGKWILGATRETGGPFLSHVHSVNYLESHDGYTLGDFIRIAGGTARPGQRIGDFSVHVRLTPEQLRIAKLAAVMLLTSRGTVMLHAGQEFARTKVIADSGITDARVGTIDHNSYEKDDETNWIDYTQCDVNRSLFEYYRGLITLRKTYPELRRAEVEQYTFLETATSVASGFVLTNAGAKRELVVLVNANTTDAAEYHLPPGGKWRILVDGDRAGTSVLGRVDGQHIVVPPVQCRVLQRENR
ncbi:MAG: DUF3459 domain-containing protein [Bacteroidetes bacterium]|nr:DUF3459 domain-containing protein [Bacteroidota bacterium]